MKSPEQDAFESRNLLFEQRFAEHLFVSEEDDDVTGEWVKERDGESAGDSSSVLGSKRPESNTVQADEAADYTEDAGRVSSGGTQGGAGIERSTFFTDPTTGKRMAVDYDANLKSYIVKNPDGSWRKANDSQNYILSSTDALNLTGRKLSEEEQLLKKAIGLSESQKLTEKELREKGNALREINDREAKKKEEAYKSREADSSDRQSTPENAGVKEPKTNTKSDDTEHLKQKKTDLEKEKDRIDKTTEEKSGDTVSSKVGESSSESGSKNKPTKPNPPDLWSDPACPLLNNTPEPNYEDFLLYVDDYGNRYYDDGAYEAALSDWEVDSFKDQNAQIEYETVYGQVQEHNAAEISRYNAELSAYEAALKEDDEEPDQPGASVGSSQTDDFEESQQKIALLDAELAEIDAIFEANRQTDKERATVAA